MEIKIENHLSEQEIKDIVISEFRQSVKDKFKTEKDIERILINLSYQMLWDEIDKLVPDYKEVVSIKVKEVMLNKDFTYNIFRPKSAWDREDSLGYTYMQRAINENKSLIEDKIINVIITFIFTKCNKQNNISQTNHQK